MKLTGNRAGIEYTENPMFAELKSKKSIISLAKQINTNPGIYFLIKDDEIVYVGQSINPRARIAYHQANTDKNFDKFTIIYCSENELNDTEAKYIVAFRPKYNCDVLPQNSIFASWAIIKRMTGLSHWALKKWCKERNIKPVNFDTFFIEDFSELLDVTEGTS